MYVVEQLEDYVHLHQPLALTIGNFDGVHRGHQAILQRIQDLAGPNGEAVVLTFRNHPSEVLRPAQPSSLLCTPIHKIRLLQAYGIDRILLLSFTHDLAQHTAEAFIAYLHHYIPFSHLVLGQEATLGKDRQGHPEVMQRLSREWGFTLSYEEPHRFAGEVISSTFIREAVKRGDFARAAELLGRSYSLYAAIKHGEGRGATIGFPTANFETEKLCMPPSGVYAIEAVDDDGRRMPGVANIGTAPTVRPQGPLLLEAHFFDRHDNLYGKYLEIFFKAFIRPERKFPDVEALRCQIALDVETAKTLLT